MSWTLSDSGTKTATVAGSVTATNASPCVFSATNTLSNGDMVVLGGVTAPTGFTLGTTYYAVAVSGSTFELSATSGGSAINSSSTGTSVTATYEHILATDTNNATFPVEVDISNVVNSGGSADFVEIRGYSICLSGGTQRQYVKGAYQGGMIINPLAVTWPIASDQSIMVTLKQLVGTGRAFPWKVLRQ